MPRTKKPIEQLSVREQKLIDIERKMTEAAFKKKWNTSSEHFREMVILAKTYKW